MSINKNIENNSNHSRFIAKLQITVCLLASVVFGCLSIRDVQIQRAQARAPFLGQRIQNINASTLLMGRNQFQGYSSAPYTLVEFGDYECPPCRETQPLVVAALHTYGTQIKLDFRELPLTSIHPHAEVAAQAAESGRPLGKFWLIHDRLYAAQISMPGEIGKILASAGVSMNVQNANKQIKNDAELENELLIHSTPSFLLCCPDGTVLRLKGIGTLGVNLP